jgi:hypothetical protein
VVDLISFALATGMSRGGGAATNLSVLTSLRRENDVNAPRQNPARTAAASGNDVCITGGATIVREAIH